MIRVNENSNLIGIINILLYNNNDNNTYKKVESYEKDNN